jgi:hypothetical protein
MYDSGMSSSTAGRLTMQLWLRPVCSLQVKDNYIGKVLSMFVFSSKD